MKIKYDDSYYEGEVDRSMRPHGIGILVFKDGSKFYGEWKRGIRSGHGVLIDKYGQKYIGEWKGDKMCGHGIGISLDGRKYEGEWKDDMICGYGNVHIQAVQNMKVSGKIINIMGKELTRGRTAQYMSANGKTINAADMV